MRGIVYVVWGDRRYAVEAEAASKRAKWFITNGGCDLQTCCLTDNPDVIDATQFDVVKKVDFGRYDGLHPFFRKWLALLESPFESSVYMDTECHVTGDINLGFLKAEKFGCASVIAPGMTFELDGAEVIHFNGGVLFFSGRPVHLHDSIVTEGKRLADSGHEGDEAAFSLALNEINPVVLPSLYNCVRAGHVHDRKIRVFHGRREIPTHLGSNQFGDEFTVQRRSTGLI